MFAHPDTGRLWARSPTGDLRPGGSNLINLPNIPGWDQWKTSIEPKPVTDKGWGRGKRADKGWKVCFWHSWTHTILGLHDDPATPNRDVFRSDLCLLFSSRSAAVATLCRVSLDATTRCTTVSTSGTCLASMNLTMPSLHCRRQPHSERKSTLKLWTEIPEGALALKSIVILLFKFEIYKNWNIFETQPKLDGPPVLQVQLLYLL